VAPRPWVSPQRPASAGRSHEWRYSAVVPSYYRDPTAPEPNAPRKIGVGALIERNGLVLVERRADSIVDEWAFIGGSLEDESVLDGLHREVLEETGFEIEQATLFGVFSDPTRIVAYLDGTVCRVTSIVFRVTPAGSHEPIPSEESAEMRFVSRADLARLAFWPAHRPIRDALLADPESPVVA
jgi:8-oxo-dGTP pyrophosphatase MutT (NUDIX family)